MYQYMFLVLWFVLLVGTIVSLASFTHTMFTLLLVNARLVVNSYNNGNGLMGKRGVWVGGGCGGGMVDCEDLTVREVQYMKLIRKKNDIMYSEVLHLIRQEKAK